MKDFFVTLMSNSSLNYFPGNKASSFTVILPEKIILTEKWSVALAEIHYNYNLFNVTSDNNSIILKIPSEIEEEEVYDEFGNIVETLPNSNHNETGYFEDNDEHVFIRKIEPGYYDNVSDLIIAVNDEIRKVSNQNEKAVLSINKLNNRTAISQGCIFSSIVFKGRLAMQLGFEPESNILECLISPYIGNIFYGIPDQMLVYSDIIQPSIVGHEKSYVLKIVNTEARCVRFGDSCYTEFHNLHYIPIQKRELNTITIDIRDYNGNLMPFRHGVLTVKLHFHKNQDE